MLLQLGVLRFSLLQDGDVGIGIFPEGKEILVSGTRRRFIAGKRSGASQAEMRQRNQWKIHDHAGMIEDLLKLRGSVVLIF